MRIDAIASPTRRALATNASDTSFPSKIPTITEPVNDGVIQLVPAGAGSGLVTERMKVWPFGLGSDNDAFSLRIIGWNRIGSGPPPGILWFPTIIVEVAAICSAAVGIAGSPVLNTERFTDTITVTTQRKFIDADSGGVSTRGTVEVFSPTNDLIGFLIIPLTGFEKVEFIFDQTTGTPTMNVLIATL